jgi:hypothetical protein
MMQSLADVLQGWYGFFSLIGTASATLRALLSPTVVHFSAVLAACLVAVAPVRSWALGGVLVGVDGLFGAAYGAFVWRSIVRHGMMAKMDLDDRFGYAVVPVIAHALTIAAAVLLLLRSGWGCGLLALAMGLLLLVGIRNAWDMTSWIVMRQRGS